MGAPIAEVAVDGETQVDAPTSSPTDDSQAVVQPAADRIGTLLKDVAPVGPTGSGGPISSDDPGKPSRPSAGADIPPRSYVFLKSVESTSTRSRALVSVGGLPSRR